MDIRLVWLLNWLFFCLCLLFLYFFLKFFVWLNDIKWVKKTKEKHLLIERSCKFNKKHVNKISCSKMKENISNSDFKKLAIRPAWFELFEKEKIVFFEVPWGEVYCECSENDYNELVDYLKKKVEESRQKTKGSPIEVRKENNG